MDKSDLLAMVRETKGFHFFLGNSAKLGNRVRDICLLLSRDSCTSRPTDILDACSKTVMVPTLLSWLTVALSSFLLLSFSC
jgi:hypothetical protein